MDALQREWTVMQQRRVLALMLKATPPQPGSKRAAVMKLLNVQPLAHRIRFEGKCHCRGQMLMSYVLPFETYTPKDPTKESCGYYCCSCKFSNAGSRQRNSST